jgi:hypothetical protein
MKDSFVRLPLRRTWRHWTYSLLLHFHMTSMMMPRAPPTVAPSPILSQNWETLARLASWWSNPLDVDTCPHTVFIRLSVLRCKPANLLPLVLRPKPRNHRDDFESQITKPSTLVLRPKPRNHRNGFEAKPLTNYHHQFWGSTKKPMLLISSMCTMRITHGVTQPLDHLAIEYPTCA